MSTTVAPEGRKLLRVEARNAQTPIESKPDWLRTRAVVSDTYQEVRGLVREKSLHTVCAEANCPNIYECWQDREATFLLGGALCTRRCDFCDIATGRPTEYDKDEPRRIAESVRDLDLRYVTITGVTRDDLPDGAAWLYAETCRLIHELNPGTGVELLVDDFRGQAESIDMVIEAGPQVFAHNLETVPGLYLEVRPGARYYHSLRLLQRVAVFLQGDVALIVALAALDQGMRMTGSIGTAEQYLKDYPIAIACKTGTAQWQGTTSTGSFSGSDNASFVLYAPADDPEIAIAVYIERGSQGGNLANVCIPILDAYFSSSAKYETVATENIAY